MKIVGRYSVKNGEREVKNRFGALLAEVEDVIAKVDSTVHMTKTSKEKTMAGAMLYSPMGLNKAFKTHFHPIGWKAVDVPCQYPTQYYTPGYIPGKATKGAFREMDFVKNKLGVEVQFGKYAFMVYNVCAKMTIFRNLGFIDCGVEIVPVKSFAQKMSTGVSYFEQFVWDLEQRGSADIDIPVLVLGIDV